MVDGGRQWALPRGSVLPSILLVLYVQCALGEGVPGLGNDALVDGSEHHFSASPSSASALLGDCVEQLWPRLRTMFELLPGLPVEGAADLEDFSAFTEKGENSATETVGAKREPTVATHATPELAPGTLVEIHSLSGDVSLTQYNGRRGRIVRFVGDIQRYGVRVDGGRMLSLSPLNLAEARESRHDIVAQADLVSNILKVSLFGEARGGPHGWLFICAMASALGLLLAALCSQTLAGFWSKEVEPESVTWTREQPAGLPSPLRIHTSDDEQESAPGEVNVAASLKLPTGSEFAATPFGDISNLGTVRRSRRTKA